jgi:YVTN family beta-propeller protein
MFRKASLVCILTITTAVPVLAAPRLLVLSRDEQALKVYDAGSFELLFSVTLPGDPHEVATSHDGRYAYVGDYEGLDNTVSVIDLQKQERIKGIKMEPSYKPHDSIATADDSRLYVTCEANRVIVEIDLKTLAPTRRFQLRDDGVHILTLSPDEKHIFATSQVNGTVSVVDRATGELDRTIFSGPGAEGIDVTPDGSEMWVVNRRVQTLSVIDTKEWKRQTTMSCVGNPLRIKIFPQGDRAVVTCALSNDVAIIDLPNRAELKRINVGNFPVGVDMNPDGSQVYVTNARESTVSVIDASSDKVIRTFNVGGNPEGILYVR